MLSAHADCRGEAFCRTFETERSVYPKLDSVELHDYLCPDLARWQERLDTVTRRASPVCALPSSLLRSSRQPTMNVLGFT